MFRSETSYNHNTYFVIENRKFGCYLIKICIIFFSYTAIVNLLLFCPLKVYVPSIYEKNKLYIIIYLLMLKFFIKKKLIDNNMCFKTLKIIPIVCRTDLILRLLKFISLKVGRYLLCRSYDIVSFDPVPSHKFYYLYYLQACTSVGNMKALKHSYARSLSSATIVLFGAKKIIEKRFKVSCVATKIVFSRKIYTTFERFRNRS